MKYIMCFIGYILLILVLSCTKNGEIEIVNDECETVNYCSVQMLNDTIDLEDSLFMRIHINFVPLYIGKDTLCIDLKKPTAINQFLHDIGKGINERKYHIPDSTTSDVYLDTTIKVNHRPFKLYNYTKDFEVCDCEGYAFFIKNKSADTLILGEGKYIPIVLQGMNRFGEWMDLHESALYMDNYGVGLLLPPRNIALFSVPKIKLDNYKRYRVRYNKFISNSFGG